jgi:arsenate reductase
MIKLYGIYNCDKIKKAEAWLKREKINYQFHDYKKAGCDAALAQKLLSQFPHKILINTRGTTWRNLPDKLKKSLEKEKLMILMQNNPSIIKRPIFEINDQWVIGYDVEALQKHINH